MRQITIIVGVPNRVLSPNGRAHWRTKASAKKLARAHGMIAAGFALNGRPAPKWESATVVVRAWFKDKRSKWDRDNAISSLKGHVDGIADAGILSNDRGLKWGEVDLSGIDKANPRVELTFTHEEESR